MRPDTPAEATNRAWSIASSLLDGQRAYCADPTAKDDLGHDYSHLINEIGHALSGLSAVRDRLTSESTATPDPQLLLAIDTAESVATNVQVITFIKFVRDTETSLVDLRAAIAVARRPTT